MYQLYYHPGDASLAPHLVLNELRVAHELLFVDRSKSAQKSATYLRLNPHGRIPTLMTEDGPLYEAAAICLYLGDRHPAGGGASGAHVGYQRGRLYQWLFYLSNTLQPELMDFHYPERAAGDDAALLVRGQAEARATEMFRIIDAELRGRRFLLGEHLGVCDYYLLMLCRWARSFAMPPRDLRMLRRLLGELLERPAVHKTFAREGIERPFV